MDGAKSTNQYGKIKSATGGPSFEAIHHVNAEIPPIAQGIAR